MSLEAFQDENLIAWDRADVQAQSDREFVSRILYIKDGYQFKAIEENVALQLRQEFYRRVYKMARQPQAVTYPHLYQRVREEKDLDVPLVQLDESEWNFMFWEVLQTPSPLRIYQLIKSNPSLISKFFKLQKQPETSSKILGALEIAFTTDANFFNEILVSKELTASDWARAIYLSKDRLIKCLRPIQKMHGNGFAQELLKIFESKEYYKALPYLENFSIMNAIDSEHFQPLVKPMIEWVAQSPFGISYLLDEHMFLRFSFDEWIACLNALVKAKNIDAIDTFYQKSSMHMFIPGDVYFMGFFGLFAENPTDPRYHRVLKGIASKHRLFRRVPKELWGMTAAIFTFTRQETKDTKFLLEKIFSDPSIVELMIDGHFTSIVNHIINVPELRQNYFKFVVTAPFVARIPEDTWIELMEGFLDAKLVEPLDMIFQSEALKQKLNPKTMKDLMQEYSITLGLERKGIHPTLARLGGTLGSFLTNEHQKLNDLKPKTVSRKDSPPKAQLMPKAPVRITAPRRPQMKSFRIPNAAKAMKNFSPVHAMV